jgi:hypothetical protein
MQIVVERFTRATVAPLHKFAPQFRDVVTAFCPPGANIWKVRIKQAAAVSPKFTELTQSKPAANSTVALPDARRDLFGRQSYKLETDDFVIQCQRVIPAFSDTGTQT